MSRALLASLAAAFALTACSDRGRTPTALPTAPSLSIGTGAHFQKSSDAIDGAGVLSATFVEAGLGNTAPSINVALTASPPASTLDCPGGQVPVMVNVSYTNCLLTDVTNSVVAALTDQSTVFFTLKR